MSSQIFQKSRSYIQILGARRWHEGIFHTEDHHFWNGLQNSLFWIFWLVNVNWYIRLYVREKTAVIMLKLLDATVQNLVAKICEPLH